MHTDDIFDDLDVNDGSGAGDTYGSGGSRNRPSRYDRQDLDEVEDEFFEEEPAEEDELFFEDLDEQDIGQASPQSKKTAKKKNKKGFFWKARGKSDNPKPDNASTGTGDGVQKKKRSRIKRIVAGVIVEVLTLAVICVYGYILRTWSLVQNEEIDLSAVENTNLSLQKREEMERGYWTVAIFGVDSRNDNVVERGLNSDVIIIASINRSTGDIKLVSVFRDTYLNISENNLYSKINAAYSAGGPEQAIAALNKNLDLNITDYVAFNWKAVAEGINILGGVDGITISRAELYYINAYITETVKVTGVGSTQLTHTGEQHLDGVQAVAYGRLRYMDNDFARTERQRNVIKAAFSKAKDASFSVLNNIMVVCFPQVATNINLATVVQMAQNITRYNIADTGGFPWSRSGAVIGNKGDCVIPTTLESNVIKLHEFLYDDEGYEPTDAVLSISERIKSDSGLYYEGQVIESVSTSGGVIQSRSSTSRTHESNSDEDEEETTEETRATIGIDENGNYIYETDEDGEFIIPTDEDGEVIRPTDEHGNTIWDSATGTVRPTELESETDEEGNPISRGDDNAPDGSRDEESSGPPDETTGSNPLGGGDAGPGGNGLEGPGADIPSDPDTQPTQNTGSGTDISETPGALAQGPDSGGPVVSDTPGVNEESQSTDNASDSNSGSSANSGGPGADIAGAGDTELSYVSPSPAA